MLFYMVKDYSILIHQYKKLYETLIYIIAKTKNWNQLANINR